MVARPPWSLSHSFLYLWPAGTPAHPLGSTTAGILVPSFLTHVLPPFRSQAPSERKDLENFLPNQLTWGLNREHCISLGIAPSRRGKSGH